MASPGEILMSYETYAHVKDQVCGEERGQINVKGISHPWLLTSYKVIDFFDNLGESREFIHEESARLKLDIDMEAMSIRERSDAVTVLQRAVDRLSRVKEAADPVIPVKEHRV
jgi:hypothetical protein